MTFELVEKAVEEPVKIEGTRGHKRVLDPSLGTEIHGSDIPNAPLPFWASPWEAGGAGPHWQGETSISQPSSHSLG